MLKTIKKLFAVLLIMFVLTGELEPMAQAYAATSTQSSSKYKLGKKFTVKYGKTVKIPNELSIKYYESRLWDSTEVSFDIEITFSDNSKKTDTMVYTPAEAGISWLNIIYCGDYRIEVTKAVHKKSITLIVTKPEKPESSVMNGSADEFYTTTSNEYFEDERFILYVPKGLTLRQDTVIMINEIMDMLEEKSGWKFLAIPLCCKTINIYSAYGYESGDEYYRNIDPEGKKIQIYIVEDFEHNGYISNASPNEFIYVYNEELENGSLSPSTVAHELAHVLQYYNLPMESDSDTFTEGFAIALSYQITEEVKDRYPEYSINYIITNDVEENPDGTPSPITKSTAQDLFEHNYRLDPAENNQQRNYQIGGALNFYILEKYGANGFVKLKKKMKKMGFVAKDPNEIYSDPNYTYPVIRDYSNALKSVFGKKFFSSFATWFKKNKKKLLTNWNAW